MPKNSLSYPKVCKRKDGKYYIDFKLNNKRYRLFSGRLIGSSLNPNSYPAKLRKSKASISGYYFSNIESKYFGLGKIDIDQVKDYAQRRNIDLKTAKKWLNPNINDI